MLWLYTPCYKRHLEKLPLDLFIHCHCILGWSLLLFVSYRSLSFWWEVWHQRLFLLLVVSMTSHNLAYLHMHWWIPGVIFFLIRMEALWLPSSSICYTDHMIGQQHLFLRHPSRADLPQCGNYDSSPTSLRFKNFMDTSASFLDNFFSLSILPFQAYILLLNLLIHLFRAHTINTGHNKTFPLSRYVSKSNLIPPRQCSRLGMYL